MSAREMERIRSIVGLWKRGALDAESSMREMSAVLASSEAQADRDAWSALMADDAVTMPCLAAVHGCWEVEE